MKNIASQRLRGVETAGRAVQSERTSQKYCDGSLVQKANSKTRSRNEGSIIEKREDSSQERVPDSIKSAVLAERAPKALFEHVRLIADKLDTNIKIKQCAIDHVVSKNTGPVPMNVRALMKGKDEGKDNSKGDTRNKDKGNGKKAGKDTTGNGKTKGKGNEAPQSTYFEGYCSTSWKAGQKSKNCRQRGMGQQGNKVNAAGGKVEQPTSTEVAKQHSTRQHGHGTERRTELIEQHTESRWTPPSTGQVQALGQVCGDTPWCEVPFDVANGCILTLDNGRCMISWTAGRCRAWQLLKVWLRTMTAATGQTTA